jgi:hypothetical protein
MSASADFITVQEECNYVILTSCNVLLFEGFVTLVFKKDGGRVEGCPGTC